MNRESRLERLERRSEQGKLAPAVSLILPNRSGSYELRFSLWDGKPGSGVRQISSTHHSEEAARAEYDRLLAQYHRKGQVEPVLIIW